MKTCSKCLPKGNTIVTWLLVQMKHKETYGYAYTDEYWLFFSLQNQGHVFVVAWSWHKEFGSTMALEEMYDCEKLTTETERHPSLHDSSLNEYSDKCHRDCEKKCTRQSFPSSASWMVQRNWKKIRTVVLIPLIQMQICTLICCKI